MSARRPELPYTGTLNTLAARTSPCPPVPIHLAVFSAVVMRIVQAEIDQAMRRDMPTEKTPVHAAYALWVGLTILAMAGTAVLVVMRVMRAYDAYLGGSCQHTVVIEP